jgi:hypothetical protein
VPLSQHCFCNRTTGLSRSGFALRVAQIGAEALQRFVETL